MKWEHSGFNVGWKERKIEAGDRKNLEGLLTYMERPAVSLRRLRYREDGMVHYQGTRFHPRLGIDHQILPPIEFLASWSLMSRSNMRSRSASTAPSPPPSEGRPA